MNFVLHPIGWIRKTKTATRIVLYKKYQPGLMGFEELSEIWVLWWFNRNDNPHMRSTLRSSSQGRSGQSAPRRFRYARAHAAQLNRVKSVQDPISKK
jgi:tRNA (Thr-GGU) A37 N-methylase